MSRRPSPALILAAWTAAALAGCGTCGGRSADGADLRPRAEANEPCVPLAVPEVAAPAGAPRSDHLFVVKTLRFGRVDDGLDLDCTDTPEECRSDFCRDGPEDGREGADNRLGPLALRLSDMAGSDLQREMTRAVERGEHPLLLRIIGATGPREGRAEAVELSFGLDADGDPSDLFSGHGRVRPDPEGPSERPSRFEPVAISGGTVVAGPTRDWMPLFWTRGEIAAVPVETSYLRFRLEPDPAGEGLRVTGGLLAGAIAPGSLSHAVLDMDARTAKVLGRLGPIVRALVRRQADLDLVPGGPTEQTCEEDRGCPSGRSCRGGRCTEPEERFDALSFGVRFEAVAVGDAP